MLRATFAGFSTAYSALQASQKRLDIVGQNLSNMNTPGYTRQALKTSSLNYTHPVAHYTNGSETSVGFGVHMDKVTQLRDPYLDAQYRDQIRKSGYSDGIQTAFDRLAGIFDESEINGIRKAFDDIEATLLNMQDASKINDPIYESELRARMQALTNLLNDADRKITEAEKDEYTRLDGESTTQNGAEQNINEIIKQIGNLNRQIKDNQIFGQPSLELMDERNMLLDELASYIPIEVTYYKDKDHDGIDENGNPAPGENYYLDSNGHPYAKKDWPDDLRVDMLYVDKDGVTQRITLVEGTVGNKDDNIGHLDIHLTDKADPTKKPLTYDHATTDINVIFTSAKLDSKGNAKNDTLTLETDKDQTSRLPDNSGSLQASLDMLWKAGENKNLQDDAIAGNSVNGYGFYRNQLDTLAEAFATVINKINIAGSSNDPNNLDNNQFLIANRDNNTATGITAANIGINIEWSNGSVHVSKSGESANETILNLHKAMSASWPPKGGAFTGMNGQPIPGLDGNDPDIKQLLEKMKDNSFSDFTNYTATILANDSYSNKNSLKTNITVLNGIQESRDSVSGVSLDEEAANMMVYMSAYNAASRLMTTLDEALNILINNTGLVGR